ncbi:cupin-like domain-containing protein [Parvibaculum sp.]|uniref:cupin-like domain-containing protein n=1 Tax=Parvibaculum sp. TaxID=2024848 RepID=UPI001B0C230F|nr:cupin-like domain-containing protein [Parvibaculum sp.]MBO6669220.1 cupin-like domain-containing protein [Parvibaculum sp.]MBO6693200.1 cupin-like domain-containing protein [Parvibaculum sp.]MBO6713014.1 cupin-like domain-containing protein [Parvibaculum sp.]
MNRLIEVTKGSVTEPMPRSTFRVSHRLDGHPLFALDRLARLAASLPADQVEFNGPVAPNQDPSLTPSNGLTPEETVRRIEQAKSWMVLKNVESDPEYKELLDACLDQVAEQTGGLMGGALMRQAFIFVTSPGNVTPFHSDPELNFLLQVRGQKRMSLFDHRDRMVVSAENSELYPGKHRNLPYREEFEARADQQHIAPGEGIFVPIFAPHWVQNGSEVSVSFSITWHTVESQRLVKLSYVNAMLRKLGMPQADAGERPLWDGVKVAAYDALRPVYDGLKRLVGDRHKAIALLFGRRQAAIAN